jgi:hypothetical protein
MTPMRNRTNITSIHPRIVRLRKVVKTLPESADYREALLRAMDLYFEEVLRSPDKGAGYDLEALNQLTLCEAVERGLFYKQQEEKLPAP